LIGRPQASRFSNAFASEINFLGRHSCDDGWASFAYLDSTRPSGLATPVSAFRASRQAESPG